MGADENKRLRVSDVIRQHDIKSWNSGDVITIAAGTGRGKSYFIKNVLYDIAKMENKKILMLIHRSNCTDQFQKEIERDKKTDIIDIETYQSLEAGSLHSCNKNLSIYKYIVSDEWHYFLSDAAFNYTTDLSLDVILSQTKAIRIFMSATGADMKVFLNEVKGINTIDYELPLDYCFIKSLTFFHNEDNIEMLINKFIEEKTKAIFFIQSVEKAYKLFKKYKQYCMFNCSKNNNKYKYVDQDKLNSMLVNERFEDLILITTSCLDTGVNLIDEDLKACVVNIRDTGSLIQCLGRKRQQGCNDKLDVYIQTINKQKLGGIETTTSKRLNVADYFLSHTLEEFLEKYQRQYDAMIYDISVNEKHSEKRLNQLMYYKNKFDLQEIRIIKSYGDFGYCRYLADMFGFEYYNILENDNRKLSLSEYLDTLVGEKLDKEGQKELIEHINVRVNGTQQKSYPKLNEGLKMIKLPYIILPKRTNQHRYWIVEKIAV